MRLLLVRGNQEDDAGLALDEFVFTQAGEVAGENGQCSGLSTAPTDHSDEFVHTLIGFAGSTGQLIEDFTFGRG